MCFEPAPPALDKKLNTEVNDVLTDINLRIRDIDFRAEVVYGKSEDDGSMKWYVTVEPAKHIDIENPLTFVRGSADLLRTAIHACVEGLKTFMDELPPKPKGKWVTCPHCKGRGKTRGWACPCYEDGGMVFVPEEEEGGSED